MVRCANRSRTARRFLKVSTPRPWVHGARTHHFPAVRFTHPTVCKEPGLPERKPVLKKPQVQKTLLVLTLLALVLLGGRLSAEDAKQVGIVSHVKVLSDKCEDVSSPEAWKRSYITAGMSDQEKVLAIWRTVVKYRHQIDPPDEYLQDHAHDIFKTIHVYGYGQCCCASSHVETLARYLGLEARGWAINLHSVPEVQYDNAWHTVNGSLMNYFLNPDGKIASVADIKKAVLEWHAQHPGYRGNDGKLRQFAANYGWKKGPPLLASSGERFWDANGINMAGWHGWPSTMQEYDCKEFLFDYGGSMGYELNVQLREGERLTRNWFNRGLHVNQLEGAGDHALAKDVAPLGMCRKLGDVAPGRIGNGTLEYDVPWPMGPFAAARWRPRTWPPAKKTPLPPRPSTSKTRPGPACS